MYAAKDRHLDAVGLAVRVLHGRLVQRRRRVAERVADVLEVRLQARAAVEAEDIIRDDDAARGQVGLERHEVGEIAVLRVVDEEELDARARDLSRESFGRGLVRRRLEDLHFFREPRVLDELSAPFDAISFRVQRD